LEDDMTDAKTPAAKTPAKDTPKDDTKNTSEDAKAQSGDRKDVSGDQQVQEREDIGAAAGEGKPDTVKVITEVRPGLAN
jgi:hypothetical protein